MGMFMILFHCVFYKSSPIGRLVIPLRVPLLT